MGTFEVRVEKIVAGGDGLAHHDGKVVFVPGAAPGERHRVEAVVEKRDYVKSRSVARLETAETRREPPCPYYGTCGGCSLMHLEPEAQLAAKKDILLESLTRAGHPGYDGPIVTRAAEELAYRSRLRFHAASPSGGPILGFRERGSRRVVDIERCALGSPGLDETWARLRAFLARKAALARHLVGVELSEETGASAEGQGRGRTMARFVVRRSDGLRRFGAAERRALLEEIGLEGFVVEPESGWGRVRAGTPRLGHELGGFRWQQSAGSFFQSNRFLLEALLEEAVPRRAVARALDLYCGVGLFTLPLSRVAERVVGVESSPTALKDARANARRAGRTNIRFENDDAVAFVRRQDAREDDFVLLDPPRGGLGAGLVDALGEARRGELRYVSCDPAAFGRDAARLSERGYRLEALALLDFFPNTHHFETVSRWVGET